MSPTLALTFCTVLVGALLIVERRGSRAASWAVWVPTVWMLISGSRPIGTWFGAPVLPVDKTVEAGSPLDRLVLSLLIVLAVAVSVKRRIDWYKVGKDNAWLLVLFMYMGASILWSDFPVVSFKRWIRALGPPLMAVVILSEGIRLQAFEAVFRRAAYVLIPFSLVLIKYYPEFGIEYDPYGQRMWTGVAMQKNGLGQVCAVSVFVLTWMALKSWLTGKPDRSRIEWVADFLVVGISIYLLRGPVGSYSATSIAMLVIGSAILILLQRFDNVAGFLIRHLKGLILLIAVTYWLFAQYLIGLIAPALGRDPSLTGRTHIWQVLLDVAARSPLIGLGYGGFWGLHPEIANQLSVGQSHNGYLGVYLELGAIGLILLSAFIFAFCGKVRRVLDKGRDLSILAACFLVMILLYNLSESAFLTSGFLWTTVVLLAVLSSSAAAASGESALPTHIRPTQLLSDGSLRHPNTPSVTPRTTRRQLRRARKSPRRRMAHAGG